MISVLSAALTALYRCCVWINILEVVCLITCTLCLETDQPARYNSKLMNSIWGRYNEHSVHNFKSLQCGAMAAAATGAQNGMEVGQTMMQPPSPSLCSR